MFTLSVLDGVSSTDTIYQFWKILHRCLLVSYASFFLLFLSRTNDQTWIRHIFTLSFLFSTILSQLQRRESIDLPSSFCFSVSKLPLPTIHFSFCTFISRSSIILPVIVSGLSFISLKTVSLLALQCLIMSSSEAGELFLLFFLLVVSYFSTCLVIFFHVWSSLLKNSEISKSRTEIPSARDLSWTRSSPTWLDTWTTQALHTWLGSRHRVPSYAHSFSNVFKSRWIANCTILSLLPSQHPHPPNKSPAANSLLSSQLFGKSKSSKLFLKSSSHPIQLLP